MVDAVEVAHGVAVLYLLRNMLRPRIFKPAGQLIGRACEKVEVKAVMIGDVWDIVDRPFERVADF